MQKNHHNIQFWHKNQDTIVGATSHANSVAHAWFSLKVVNHMQCLPGGLDILWRTNEPSSMGLKNHAACFQWGKPYGWWSDLTSIPSNILRELWIHSASIYALHLDLQLSWRAVLCWAMVRPFQGESSKVRSKPLMFPQKQWTSMDICSSKPPRKRTTFTSEYKRHKRMPKLLIIATTTTKFVHLTWEQLWSCGKENEGRRGKKKEAGEKEEKKKRKKREKKKENTSHVATLVLPKPKTAVCGIVFVFRLRLSDAPARMKFHFRAWNNWISDS